MELVDILNPPTFEKSGVVKPREQAFDEEEWIGTFNLWILQSKPVPAIVYQQRSSRSTWAPLKLDVTAGGHYQAGETIIDGMREVEEELGKKYAQSELTHMGRKLHVSPDTKGRMRHNVVEIFFVVDDSPLSSYVLEELEVYALISCPLDALLSMYADRDSFEAIGVTYEGKPLSIGVTADSFPYNWDRYHFKIALLAERYLGGERNLLY